MDCGTVVPMSTRIDYEQTFAGTPDEVFAMLTDPEFIVHKCTESGSVDVTADVDDTGGEVTITNHRVLPAKLPSWAKRFVGETIPITDVQRWHDVAADGSRDATFDVEFTGQPLDFHGTMTLRASDDGTVIHTVGALKANVPLIGGKVERMASDWITRFLNKEQRVGNAWLES